MNPSAPVTRTGTPASEPSAIAARPIQLVALADIDPVVLDLERADAATVRQRGTDQVGHGHRLARLDAGDDGGVQDVHPGVHLTLEGRLLDEADDPVAVALDAA